jgi:hypothetical protein
MGPTFHITLSALSNRQSSAFPYNGPAQSQVNHLTILQLNQRDQTLISRVGLLHYTSIVIYPLGIAMTNGKPPTDRVNKDNREG